MNTEGTGFYTCKECHTTESLSKHTTIIHKEREPSGDRRNFGESSCNSGDGTGQMAQPLMFMMMIIPGAKSFWEDNRFSESQGTPLILWDPKGYYHLRKCPLPVPTLSQINPVHNSPFTF